MTGGQRLSGYSAAAPPEPGVLYGAQGGTHTTSDLYVVDPSDGSTVSLGALGFALTGLAFEPGSGVLFGVTSNNSANNPRSLITVDIGSGAGTLVGALGVSNGLADIAFRSDGVLYGYTGSTRTLYTVDTVTGTATQVSATAIPPFGNGYGLDFDGDDRLFVFPKGSTGVYYTVDEATGTLTSQATLNSAPVNGSVASASFTAPAVLYATLIPAGTTHLVTIDTLTGAVTDIGDTLLELDALAWDVRADQGAPTPN